MQHIRPASLRCPCFFLCVLTNSGYVVVGLFVLPHETAYHIKRGLEVLKSWNPTWNPQYFITDYDRKELNAIEDIFPDCFTFLCDFHREKSWKNWVTRSNGVTNKKEVLELFRCIANASNEQGFNDAVDALKRSCHWRNNEKLQNWFENCWLKEMLELLFRQIMVRNIVLLCCFFLLLESVFCNHDPNHSGSASTSFPFGSTFSALFSTTDKPNDAEKNALKQVLSNIANATQLNNTESENDTSAGDVLESSTPPLTSTSSTSSTSSSTSTSSKSETYSPENYASSYWPSATEEYTNTAEEHCYTDAVLQNFCPVPNDMMDVSFWDLYSVLFSDTVLDALSMGCTRGSWCLQDRFDYWDALMAERVDMVMESEISFSMCQPAASSCITKTVENFKDCSMYKEMVFTAEALALICQLKSNMELPDACFKHVITALHVSLADIMRDETDDYNPADDTCETPEAQMTGGLICVENSCPGEYDTFNSFKPWGWFTTVVDDLIEECDMDPTKCMALLQPGPGYLYNSEVGTMIGVSIATTVSALLLAITMCVCYKRYRRNAVIKDGYQKLLNDEEGS